MIARAPGKLVISGAYAVLQGAPALVCAVDRYVVADAARPAELVTPELRAAFHDATPPWFDASALRDRDAKLGLGSSAAIVVACLASRELSSSGLLDDAELARRVYPAALAAHRAAQPAGSGVDVAAACHGGCLEARLVDGELVVSPRALPPGLCVVVWSSGTPASTPELLARVREASRRAPAEYGRAMGAQHAAALAAARALEAGDAAGLVAALADQGRALSELGRCAGCAIVTAQAAELSAFAVRRGGAVLPAGAGGGDVVFYAGTRDPEPELSALAERLGHRRLELALGARGVHAGGH